MTSTGSLARGMDFVTITDHDTIDGALEIAHLPGAFVSEEMTAWFRVQTNGRRVPTSRSGDGTPLRPSPAVRSRP